MGNHNTGSAPSAMPDLPPTRVVNLTPHPVVVDGPEGRVTFPRSASETRIVTTESGRAAIHTDHGAVETVTTELGTVDGLPDAAPGTIYIVSLPVALAARRTDLVVPNGLKRDAAGAVVACDSLAFVGGTR